MKPAIANSVIGRGVGRAVLCVCPWEAAQCEDRGCFFAEMCHAARRQRILGMWERLVLESQLGNWLWATLALAAVVVLLLSFLWQAGLVGQSVPAAFEGVPPVSSFIPAAQRSAGTSHAQADMSPSE